MRRGSPEENIALVWERVRYHFDRLKIRDRYNRVHFGMFCKARSPNSNFPKLKGRAVEVKTLGAPLFATWTEMMSGEVTVHRQIRALLECSVRMEALLSEAKGENKFAEPAFKELMRCCDSFLVLSSAAAHHYNALGIKVFDIVPKHHLLWHVCWAAQWLNPRSSACWSGEDYMQHMRRLAQSCLKGTPSWMVSAKTTSRYVKAWTWRVHRQSGAATATSSAGL